MARNKDGSSETSLPIIRLFPNIVTIIGLCFGLFALKYAIAERWEMAVIFILVAAVIDGVDGRLARLLNASSDFGAQLDSLADFFNFGIAPALVLYMWKTHEIVGFGWAVTLFFIISMALRLARFNSSLADDTRDKELDDRFFTGVPAPCGAGLCLIPLTITFFFQQSVGTKNFEIDAIYVIIFMAVIGLLMVSRIPTISIKKMKIRRDMISFATAGVALFVIAVIIEPWFFLPLLGLLYLLTIPFSVVSFYRLRARLRNRS
jgi:CDP-diacylglycerol--serine O-phosphatidyltransferase